MLSKLKGLFVLATGNISIQIISFFLVPIIARIYGPSQFGSYQLISTIVLISSPLVGLSLFQILIKEKRPEIHLKLFSTSITFSFINPLIVIIISLLYLHYVTDEIKFGFVEIIILYLILSTNSLQTNYQSRQLSNSDYKNYTLSNIIQSIGSNGSKILLGLFSGSYQVLLASNILGYVFSILHITKTRNYRLKLNSLKESYRIATENKQFTLYFTLSSLLGIFNSWYLILVAPLFVGVMHIGLFSLAQTLIQVPLYPILKSVSNFTYNEYSKDRVNNSRYNNSFWAIQVIGFLVLIVGFFILDNFGSEILIFLFGDKWDGADEYAKLLIIPMSFNFLLGPFYNTIANSYNLNHKLTYVDILIMASSIVGVSIFKYLGLPFYSLVKFYVILNSFSYILKFYLIYLTYSKRGNHRT